MERFDSAGAGGIGVRLFLGDVEPLQLSQMGLLYSLRSTIPDFQCCSRVRFGYLPFGVQCGVMADLVARLTTPTEVMCGRIE